MVKKEQIIEALKKVYDPEIQYDIYCLGLIYDIQIKGKKIRIVMTLTSPMCPYGGALMDDVRRNASFSPAWTPERMTEEARMALGF